MQYIKEDKPMRYISLVLLLTLAAIAQQIPVNGDPIPAADGEWLQYDDGTPGWLSWGGSCRGVWFNTDDFYPSPIPYTVEAAELWFYHHSYYPWDTSETIVELWNGNPIDGFTEFLASVQLSATHYSGSYAVFDPPVLTEPDFWCLQTTELSGGGWPSILSDSGNDSPPGIHSYFVDGMNLEPFVQGSYYCNYFVRVTDDWVSLERISWGSLKSAFQ